ncbi:MAG: thiamine pyrophosphate-binding protein [Gemmataceae bacterium]
MPSPSRREVLKTAAATGVAASVAAHSQGGPPIILNGLHHRPGWVVGRMTGAHALVETLKVEGTECVYGIPGAQQNELWDTMKSNHLPYLLVTHEFSAACMADGYARSKGKPGVICVVPGPGLTNSLTGIGEALLDSVPMVCIVGDVANGEHHRPFQVHALPQANLLRPVTKHVFQIQRAEHIPQAVREAFRLACAGEPGPVGVVVPYNLLIEAHRYNSGPLPPLAVPFDEQACGRALALLANRNHKVGIYAGLGCMNHSPALVQLAELMQAPVATSISGKGAMPENHPLSVGWGYGPQGTRTAERVFRGIDTVLAIGVKYSEVSTGFYSIPQSRRLIHVDANRQNLGRIMRTDACVHSDAGAFLQHALAQANCLRRPENQRLQGQIRLQKQLECRINSRQYARCGADPMHFLMTLRRIACQQALAFVDVTCSQYWATETFHTYHPRTFFNPTDNQAMGWSIPAAIGAQKVHPHSQVLTITGDGCFLMTATEISTAGREGLPVKFFILDDQAYNYMQLLQQSAYMRTTATILARMNYRSLAQGFGVAYQEILGNEGMEARIRGALRHPGPVLVRVVTDYRRRPIRWISAARNRFIRELTPRQRTRFLARLGSRAVQFHPQND